MARRKAVLILPVLNDRNKDLTKQWYVEFSYRSPLNDKLIRVRYSKNLNIVLNSEAETIKQRYINANSYIKEISKKLKAGWLPSDDDQRIYNDEIAYSNVAKIFGRRYKAKNNIRVASSQFLIWKKPQVKAKTYSSYVSKMRQFTFWCEKNKFGDVDIPYIDNDIVKRFFVSLTEKNLDKVTVEKYRQNLFNLFEYLKNEKKIKENPVYNVLIPKKKVDNAARPLLRGDMTKLLAVIKKNDPQLYLACLFQYFTALRPGAELRLLKIKDIDFDNSSITVNEVNAKRTRHETVDMPIQLNELCIKTYLLRTFNKEFYVFGRFKTPGDKPVGKNTLRNRFNSFRDALNLPKHYKFYSMKHTGAGRLLESGASIVEVQRHLRHLSIEDTQHYIVRHFGERNEKVINHFPNP